MELYTETVEYEPLIEVGPRGKVYGPRIPLACDTFQQEKLIRSISGDTKVSTTTVYLKRTPEALTVTTDGRIVLPGENPVNPVKVTDWWKEPRLECVEVNL